RRCDRALGEADWQTCGARLPERGAMCMTRGASTRFRKGQSGNPKGRPRKVRSEQTSASAFDIVLDKTLMVTQNGVERELTVDEALLLRTYQDALAGNRPARRRILQMILRREEWLASQPSAHTPR